MMVSVDNTQCPSVAVCVKSYVSIKWCVLTLTTIRRYLVLLILLLASGHTYAQTANAVRVPQGALGIIEGDSNLALAAFELARDGGIYFEVLTSVRVRLLDWDVKQVYWMSLDGSSCRLISNLQRSPLGAWQASNAVSQCTKFTAATD